MAQLEDLVARVAVARKSFIDTASRLSSEQQYYKPDTDTWNVSENVEHMVWAEQSGINGLYRTIEALRNGKPLWSGEAIHHGLRIEEVIEKTWKPKENVPEIARPRWGGPVEYWFILLNNNQILLNELVKAMKGLDPEKVIYPHLLSGPLNVLQRMEFLRFHLERHQGQIERLMQLPSFPR
jgi:DinB superfamily